MIGLWRGICRPFRVTPHQKGLVHVICQCPAEVFCWELPFTKGATSTKTIEYCIYFKIIDAYRWGVPVWHFPAFLCIFQVFEMDCMLLFSYIFQVPFTLSPCYSLNVPDTFPPPDICTCHSLYLEPPAPGRVQPPSSSPPDLC